MSELAALEKLKHLLEHWKLHNVEHADTYLQWAETVGKMGYSELVDVLERISVESVKVNDLMTEAIKLLESPKKS